MLRMVATLVFITAAVQGEAAIIEVAADGSGDYSTIQAAVNAAATGDEVVLAVGTYRGDGNRDIDFAGKAIIVRSADPNDWEVVRGTVINCEGTEGENHRGFFLHSGEDANSVIAGLSIVNGHAATGGGICCESASPVIKSCIISSCTACLGGGICSVVCAPESDGSPRIEGCVIYGNAAIKDDFGFGGNGGGIYLDGTYDLTAKWVYPVVSGCTIAENEAEGRGGGVCTGAGCRITIENGIIWNNRAGKDKEISILPLYDVNNSEIEASYCDIRGGLGSVEWHWLCTSIAGNRDEDPKLANPISGDFHLQSEVGRWDVDKRKWVMDDVTSPAIDAGDPKADWGNELWPHGQRIDMGAYGGTREASWSLSDAGNVADLDNNYMVNWADWALFSEQWQSHKKLLRENLNRKGNVNEADLAIFVSEWLGGDIMAPEPNPMTWDTVPWAFGLGTIIMLATPASDETGVEYYFECTAGGGHSSGWQTSSCYIDTGLADGTLYSYRVKARDLTTAHNETGWSSEETAMTSLILLQDGFESGFDKWTDGGITDWDLATDQKYSGVYSAHAGWTDNDLISDNMNTSGFSSITIEFLWRQEYISENDNIYLQLYNGSTYDNRFNLGHSLGGIWVGLHTTIINSGDDAVYFRPDFRIKFEGTPLDSSWITGGENLWIDDVLITAQ